MTGEVIKIDLGFKIHIKEIENYNQYLWEKFQIIPRIIVGEQREQYCQCFCTPVSRAERKSGIK